MKEASVNLREAKLLLTEASAIDNRVVSDIAVKAWAAALDGITYEEASAALNEHRKASTEYVQPAHIVKLVKADRRARTWDAANSRPFPPPGKRYAVDVIESLDLE